MVGSIICGVDESASAQGAALVARGLSRKLGLRLVFVRVVDEGSSREKFDATAESLERFTSATRNVDSSAQWLVEVGHPADRLVAAAEDANASMIVVGSHGPRSSLLGSVSAEVSRRAPCPVVVVPPGAEDGRNEGRAISGDVFRDVQWPQRQQRRRHRPLRSRFSPDVGFRHMPGSRAKDMSNDALMRWEWEGGASDSVGEAERANPAEINDIRSQPTSRRRRARRVEVREVVVSRAPPAEPGPSHV